MNSAIRCAIWSPARQQTTLLSTDPDSAVFAAGASFLVLDVELAVDGSATLFLVERSGHTSSSSGELERQIVEHLRQELAIAVAVEEITTLTTIAP
jgi:hypothetical protein